MVELAFAPNGNTRLDSSGSDQSNLKGQTSAQALASEYAGSANFSYTEYHSAPMTETKIREDDPRSTIIPSNGGVVIPIHDPMPVATQRSSLHALQEWEGWVLETGEHEFTARLTDLTTSGSASKFDWMDDEEATFPYSEISEEDLTRLRPGSIFRWVIGYERSASGSKRRVSQIVFRDLPAMTRQDIALGEEWARKVAQSLQV